MKSDTGNKSLSNYCHAYKLLIFYSYISLRQFHLLTFTILFSALVSNRSIAQKQNHVDTVKVGFYVTAIRNIDFVNSSFNADIWVWFHYKNHDSLHINDNGTKERAKVYPDCLEWPDAIDPNNGGQPNYRLEDVEDSSQALLWKSVKVSSPFRKKWDLTNYPFDKQEISLVLESASYYVEELVLVPLKGDIDSNFLNQEREYKIEKKEFVNNVTNYATSFGNPDTTIRNSSYSKIKLTFTLTRLTKWTTFWKLFTGIFISFLMSLSVFFIKPTNLDARFGLCVGGLFSAIGSKYIVDSLIPMHYQNTLFDHIHNVTFFFILIITVISIVALNWLESENIKLHALSKKLDKIGLVISLTSYALVITIMVLNANRNINKFLTVGSCLLYMIVTILYTLNLYKKK